MKVMTFRLPEADAKDVEARAKRLNITESEFLRNMVQDGLMMAKRRADNKTEVAPRPQETKWWNRWKKNKG